MMPDRENENGRWEMGDGRWKMEDGNEVRKMDTHIMLLLKKFQVGNLITSQVTNDVFPSKKIGKLGGVLLELFYTRDDFLSLVVELGRGLIEAVELCLEVANEVGHICSLEELILGLGDGANLVVGSIFRELTSLKIQQGEDEVAVEVLHQVR